MLDYTKSRLELIDNPHQGKHTKVLCVCTAGLLRSPTAAVVLANDFDCNTRCAGISQEHALIPVDEVLLTWAEEIVCMDKEQERRIKSLLKKLNIERSIICFDIPDQYGYKNPILVQMIRERYREYLADSAIKRTQKDAI